MSGLLTRTNEEEKLICIFEWLRYEMEVDFMVSQPRTFKRLAIGSVLLP